MRWWIESVAATVAERAAGALPSRLVPWCGAMLGGAYYAAAGHHRRIALTNVKHAFGAAMPEPDQRVLVRRCFSRIGTVSLESLRLGRLSNDAMARIVTHEGLEHLNDAIARGRGVLIAAAHFGNWELFALAQGWIGHPFALIVRPLDNPRLDQRLQRLRRQSGNRIINQRSAITEARKTLHAGGTVGILIDRRPKAGIWTDFMGRPALTSTAAAVLALRTGAAVIPVTSVPESDGRYRLVYERPLDVRRTSDIDADIRRVVALYTARVEAWIRERPEHWIWMHDRWKAR